MQSSEMYQLNLVATILLSFILGASAWSYKDAHNWGEKYPECNGKKQSPIIQKPPGTEDHPQYEEPLKLTDFQKLPKKMTLQNTGRTVEIKADWSGNPPTVTGGPLHGNYVLEKTTFLWEQKKDNKWNIAYQDGLMFDMEMQLYFYKADFKSFEKAETRKGGLAVLSMGFSSGYEDPEHFFESLEKNLHKVQSPNSTAEIPSFRFASILDDASTSLPFFFYEGSLEYPPCSESVTWFIMVTGSSITGSLMSGLRNIKLAEGDTSNVRPPQALNKREVREVYTTPQY